MAKTEKQTLSKDSIIATAVRETRSIIVKELKAIWHDAGDLRELEQQLEDYIIQLERKGEKEKRPGEG